MPLAWCVIGLSGIILVAASISSVVMATPVPDLSTKISELHQLADALASIPSPSLQDPEWLRQEKIASGATLVMYSVITKGEIDASLAKFEELTNETLNDDRGWAKMRIIFKQVPEGGDFTLVLSQSSQLPSFSSGCSVHYSCRVGKYVIINQDRWLYATPAWNVNGGSLRDYQSTVINHEVGHWLGHDHESCSGVGNKAQVMQQQSVDLQGCRLNPWPLEDELWSTQLGIRL